MDSPSLAITPAAAAKAPPCAVVIAVHASVAW